ncbi:MAG: ATP synthase F1 subunit gamma [Oscillospiraceae bacterium]|nr:ATP synthase F1 subunit gamma [Oscillospiraceae bacterium]
MESMREIRNRIASVQKTIKITNAMYLMASSKLKKARKALEETGPYFDSLQRAIAKIILHTDLSNERFFATDKEIPEDEVRHGYIIITSDKGLAGAYNHNVCRAAEEELKKSPYDVIFCIGKSGKNHFERHPELRFRMDEPFCYSAGTPSLWLARELADHVIELFLSGELDAVHVVYTRMKNALTANTEMIQLLPLRGQMFPSNIVEDSERYLDVFEPSPEVVLHKIIPNYVKGMLYGAMVESYAAEQNARMTAMDSATDNARAIVSALSLEYNRVRQSQITTEITEVISGAAAQE